MSGLARPLVNADVEDLDVGVGVGVGGCGREVEEEVGGLEVVALLHQALAQFVVQSVPVVMLQYSLRAS